MSGRPQPEPSWGPRRETVRITDACTACGSCLATCPERALRRAPKRPLVVDLACTACWACIEICPAGAIEEAVAGGAHLRPMALGGVLVWSPGPGPGSPVEPGGSVPPVATVGVSPVEPGGGVPPVAPVSGAPVEPGGGVSPVAPVGGAPLEPGGSVRLAGTLGESPVKPGGSPVEPGGNAPPAATEGPASPGQREPLRPDAPRVGAPA